MPRSNEGSGRFTVTLPKAVIGQLDDIAEERGTMRAILMREAVLFWLKAQQSKQRREVA